MVNLRRKMALEGLKSFIVSYDNFEDDTSAAEAGGSIPDPEDVFIMQFWAEDAGHAGSQFDDAEPTSRVLLVETQNEYENRTGETLDY